MLSNHSGISPGTCQQCGASVTDGARFCRHCGHAITTTRVCANCSAALSPGARFCKNCGQPVAPTATIGATQPLAPQNPKPLPSSARPLAVRSHTSHGSGHRRRVWVGMASALVMIVLIGVLGGALVSNVFDQGGVNLRGSQAGAQQPAPTVFQPHLQALASELLAPADQPQTVAWDARVSVTIPGGALPAAQQLTISAVADAPPPLASSVYASGAVYDIAIGDLHRFNQPLSIELTYDPAQLSPAVPAADQLAIGTWNPQAQEWAFIPAQVDEARQVVQFQTNHLSIFGWFYIQSGYTAKNTFEHFRIIYDADLSAAFTVPGEGRKNGIERFAHYTGAALEQAYTRYQQAGFRMPTERYDVIIGDWSSSSASPTAGVIYIVYNADWPEMAFDAAHELFHIVQNQYLDGNEMAGLRWWMEATADYAAGRIAWDRGSPAGLFMGESIKARYLEQSIEFVSETKSDPHFRHQYHTAHLLDFMIYGVSGGQPDREQEAATFRDMWGRIVDKINENDDNFLAEEEDLAGDWDVAAHMADWLGSKQRLNAAYQEFAAFYLFNRNSPIPVASNAPHDKTPAEAAAAWTQMRLNDREVTSPAFNIPARYASALWGVVVEVDPAQPARTVKVESPVDLLPDTAVYIYILPGDKRVDLGFGQGPVLIESLDTAQREVTIEVQSGAGLYLLAVNASNSAANMTLKLSASSGSGTLKTFEEIEPENMELDGRICTIFETGGALSPRVFGDDLCGCPSWMTCTRNQPGEVTWSAPPNMVAAGQSLTLHAEVRGWASFTFEQATIDGYTRDSTVELSHIYDGFIGEFDENAEIDSRPLRTTAQDITFTVTPDYPCFIIQANTWGGDVSYGYCYDLGSEALP